MMQRENKGFFKLGLMLVAWMAMLILLVSLAIWQVHRGQEKTQLLAAFSASQLGPVLYDPGIEQFQILSKQDSIFARACFGGRFDAAHQFLLDGQIEDGRVGFHVWTPLALPAGNWLMVDRGWVAQSQERLPLADMAIDDTARKVCGTLVRFPQSGWAMAPESRSEAWPRVVVYPSAGDVEQALARPVRPLLLLLDARDEKGFDRHWKPVTMMPERHYGYAFQWAALAITWIVASFVYWRRRRGELRSP